MLEVITNTLPVFIAIALGKIFAYKKILPKDAENTISTITFTIIGPFFVFDVLYGVSINADNFHLVLSPLVVFISMLILSYMFGKLVLRLDPKKLGAMILGLITFGAGAVYPFVTRNFSDEVFTDFVVADLVSFLIFLTMGSIVAVYLGKKRDYKVKDLILDLLKDPFVLTILLTFTLTLTGVKVPGVITETAKFFSGSFLLLASLFVGMTLRFPDWKNFTRLVVIYIFRIGVVLGLVCVISRFFGLSNEESIPLYLIFLAQYSVLSVVFAKKQGLDHEFASQMVLFSTIIQLFLYPVLVGILQ
ncbi:MAG: hypothetical protein U9Q67_01885 [Patescibacteria group bacterium]|nr:hypothetical protein [Patescibacteria group bacterium]